MFGRYGTFRPVAVTPQENIRLVIVRSVVVFVSTKLCSIDDRVVVARRWLIFLVARRFLMFVVARTLVEVYIRVTLVFSDYIRRL